MHSNKKSSILDSVELDELSVKHKTVRCKGCSNACLLTINDFGIDEATGKHRRFITGNRCERGENLGMQEAESSVPNMFEWKSKRLFEYYTPLKTFEATRGVVGIPRALNMYENYPFWFTFFTHLGFSVLLSDKSSKEIYEAGTESMPSESVCYPAKLSHGHIINLLSKDPDFIWMPCSKWERREDKTSGNHFNCPIVASYPEALRLNIDDLREVDTPMLTPWLPYHDKEKLKRRLYDYMIKEHSDLFDRYATPLTWKEIAGAVDAAWAEDNKFKHDIRAKGTEILRDLEKSGGHGIVLAGRPYHQDPEINHAIPELLTSFGLAVLTEDSVAHLANLERPIRVVDQWMYHTRLYAVAKFVSQREDLDLIQLNSFGCGLDALTTDQVQEILEGSGKIYTCLKIDEVSNLGAAKIRIRSLLAALNRRSDIRGASDDKDHTSPEEADTGSGLDADDVVPDDFTHKSPLAGSCALSQREGKSTVWDRPEFTKKMKDEGYTLLAPQMSPIHFEIIAPCLHHYGYNVELMPSVDREAVNYGLKYVNNDICYPSILVTGQIMEAVLSGKYDTNKLAVLITQTGGGCRATNYISLIRKALKEAGLGHIPVVALSFKDLGEHNSGWKLTPDMILQAAYAIQLGDLLMTCLYRTRPYEKVAGSANALLEKWSQKCKDEALLGIKRSKFVELSEGIVSEFDNLPCKDFGSKPRVGVVGEILVKFHPTANNCIVDKIEEEGCEVVVPGLLEFFLFGLVGGMYQREIGKPKSSEIGAKLGVKGSRWLREPAMKALDRSNRFSRPADILELGEYASEILSLCNSMGEGWLLTAEMCELIKSGTPNIVCAQPFACLPNHVVGKAVLKELRRIYPESNVVAVDYDPGASEVNQLNRIKLMISVAKANLKK